MVDAALIPRLRRAIYPVPLRSFASSISLFRSSFIRCEHEKIARGWCPPGARGSGSVRSTCQSCIRKWGWWMTRERSRSARRAANASGTARLHGTCKQRQTVLADRSRPSRPGLDALRIALEASRSGGGGEVLIRAASSLRTERAERIAPARIGLRVQVKAWTTGKGPAFESSRPVHS